MTRSRHIGAMTAPQGGLAKPRRQKPRPPPSAWPHACVVLAIDPGAVSGWAILRVGELERYGLAEDAGARGHAVAEAMRIARDRCHVLIVVAEKWSAGGERTDRRMTHVTWMGLSKQWGKWEVALELAGHPMRRVVRVYPQTWHASILGGRRVNTKVQAISYVGRRFGRTVASDEADAICIGLWASQAGEVAQVLPRRKQ